MLAAILVRGLIGVKPEIKKTILLLNLTRKNHCVVLNENEKILGMLKKCSDFITWGKISKETLRALVEKRGRLAGDKRVPQDVIDNIVNLFETGDVKKENLPIKRVFRLHPPRKGWKSTKVKWPRGALGERSDMDNLLKRMM